MMMMMIQMKSLGQFRGQQQSYYTQGIHQFHDEQDEDDDDDYD